MTMTIRNDHAMSGSPAHARRSHWTTFVLRTPVFALGAARRAHARWRTAAGVAVPMWRAFAPQGGAGGIGHCTGFVPTDHHKRSRSLAAGGDP
jgi:hypothetical protein